MAASRAIMRPLARAVQSRTPFSLPVLRVMSTMPVVRAGAKHYVKNAVMIMFSLLVIYVLSYGPVSWFWLKLRLHKHPFPDSIYRAVYKPLEDFSRIDSVGGRLYRRYL